MVQLAHGRCVMHGTTTCKVLCERYEMLQNGQPSLINGYLLHSIMTSAYWLLGHIVACIVLKLNGVSMQVPDFGGDEK